MVNKMTKEKEELIERDIKPKMLTLFILFFPSILIAIIPSEIGMNYIMSIVIKALLVFYQFVVLKNFVDKHYNY